MTATLAPATSPWRRWGALYVAEHKIRGMKAWWTTFLATSIGTPVLYLFVFGIGLGGLVTARFPAAEGATVGYAQFVIPALLCASVLQIASEEAMFTITQGFKWSQVFFAMHAAPITPSQITNGVILSTIARMAVTGALYYLICVAFGAIGLGWSVLVLPIAILTGLAFGLPLMIYTTTIEEDRGQFALIGRFVVLPLTLFGGTMFPLEALPGFLQWIGWLSPLWHGSQLARDAAYGTGEPFWLTAIHLGFLIVAAVVGWRLSVRNVRRRLTK